MTCGKITCEGCCPNQCGQTSCPYSNPYKTSMPKKVFPTKTIELFNKDFKYGTYRIVEPGVYMVKEDIVFSPNPENDFRPNKGDPNYTSLGYHLGFFAALTIECPNVTLDLGGHTMECSKVFTAAQRFFSMIELASAPFIPGQGPGNFGPTVDCASNCVIKNGTIGRSSHHGIHGNKNTTISLLNLHIRDFEVAGIAVNSLVNAKISHVKIGPGSKDVKVLGNFSAARFMAQFYDLAYYKCIEDTVNGDNRLTGSNPKETDMDWGPLRKMQAVTDEVLYDIEHRDRVTSDLFANRGLKPDGNNYGLLIHVTGVAVNDYIEEDFKGQLSKNIHIDNLSIEDIDIEVREIVGISNMDGSGVQADASGSVIQINEIRHSDGKPKHNVLADAQFNLAKYCHKHGLSVGKLSIDENLVSWYYGKLKWSDLMTKGYKLKCNGDSMFHVNKGNHGIRMDGVTNLNMSDVKIDSIHNTGRMGDDKSAGCYELSHDQQERLGYHGCDVSGVHLSYCNGVTISKTSTDNLYSANGEVRGVRLINQCKDVKLRDYTANNLTAGFLYQNGKWRGTDHQGDLTEYTASYPNIIPLTVGVFEDHNSHVDLGSYEVTNMAAPGAKVPIWFN